MGSRTRYAVRERSVANFSGLGLCLAHATAASPKQPEVQIVFKWQKAWTPINFQIVDIIAKHLFRSNKIWVFQIFTNPAVRTEM